MDCNGNILNRIEDAIINTFFEAELIGFKDQLFTLDPRNFQSSFKKRIVEKINECIAQDKSISLLAYNIVEKCKGNTNYEMLVLEILAQNPLTPKIAKEYHAHLGIRRIERTLNVTQRQT